MPQQIMPILSDDRQEKINKYLRAIDALRAHYDKTKGLLSELENAVVFKELKNMPSETRTVINVSRFDFISLKRLYKKAVEEKKNVFTFKGHQLLTSYAKYLIEYLENKFKN